MKFARSKNSVVGILITDKELIFSNLKEENQLTLQSVRCCPLRDNEIINLLVYNPTAIAQKIKLYLDQYNLTNANIILCFRSPIIKEFLISSSEHNKLIKEFNISEQEYCIESQELKMFNNLSYVAAIKHEILIQYKLLTASALPYNSLTVTTEFIALYLAYLKQKSKNKFEYSIKGLSLKQLKIILKNSFNSSQMSFLCKVDPANLMSMVGLYYLGKNN